MSDYITLEIQEEIIRRLPVRSVVRCRSVSKAWKTLIDSHQFIAAYSVRCTQPQHLLIRYGDMLEIEGRDDSILGEKYASIVDDDTFPQKKFTPTLPLIIKQLSNLRIYGSSGGLLCFYGLCPKFSKKIVVLWNPSIRKSVAIDVPNVKNEACTTLGFGVCPVTSDPKIVKISHIWGRTENTDVYTLSPNIEGTYTIMSFDTTNDEFRELYLPNCLSGLVQVSKVWESLAVLEYNLDADTTICVVWMMEHRVPKGPKPFTKLFTIKIPHVSMYTLGFRKGGKPIIKLRTDEEAGLFVYDPYSIHINNLGISGGHDTFSVNFYVETLLLLNQ